MIFGDYENQPPVFNSEPITTAEKGKNFNLAWSVEDSNGTTGVTAAGHCRGIDSIHHPFHGVHALTHSTQQHTGEWGDIEWLTSAEIEPATFYAGDGPGNAGGRDRYR